MPLLARMVGTPLAVDIRPGAVARLAPLLADSRISSGGHVAVAVGPGLGEELAQVVRPSLRNAAIRMVEGGSLQSSLELAAELREGFYDAVVGIGGGGTLDVAKHAATLTGLPMVAVATNLSHDGIASPVSSLEEAGHKGSYGVQVPLAVIVDLDYVRRSPEPMRRSGIGDVVSNLSAVADWRLAERERGEALDGVAVTLAATAAEAVLGHPDTIDDDGFLTALAEALVLSGLAMAVAGSSRPCSGSDHEIVHAIDHLFPETASHGELAGVAALFTSFLRGARELGERLDACLARHGLPRTPADVGLSEEQFARAVAYAPATRPDRYTLLEHLGLDEDAIRERLDAYLAALHR